MNNFEKSSLIERKRMEKLFEKHNVIQYKFTTESSYEQYDGIYINSRGEEVMFEVKNRNVPSDKYRTTVIEESKFNFLTSQKDKQPYIFIFFTDGLYFPYNLNDATEYKRTKMLAPKTTAGDNTKIYKDFVEIVIDKTKLYRYE